MNIIRAFKLWNKYKKPLGEAEKIAKEIASMKLSYIDALKSRTVWTTLIGGAVHLLPQVQALIPPGALPIVDASLTLLTIIFRMNPKTVPSK